MTDQQQGFAPAEEIESLRDRFAMAALTGMCAQPIRVAQTQTEYAQIAYQIADAMMEARK